MKVEEPDVFEDTEGAVGFKDESDIITIPEVFCVIIVVWVLELELVVNWLVELLELAGSDCEGLLLELTGIRSHLSLQMFKVKPREH